MITAKGEKSLRLLVSFLALGILISGWALFTLQSQHKSDRAIAHRQSVEIQKNVETINYLASALANSNASFAKTLAKAQKEIELDGKLIKALQTQVRQLGGKPILVVSDTGSSSTTRTQKAPTQKKKQTASPRSTPSPTPTCVNVNPVSTCLKSTSINGTRGK